MTHRHALVRNSLVLNARTPLVLRNLLVRWQLDKARTQVLSADGDEARTRGRSPEGDEARTRGRRRLESRNMA
jgi:hypothetical protein